MTTAALTAARARLAAHEPNPIGSDKENYKWLKRDALAIFDELIAQAEARAASWEKQARQAAARFEPMPRMHIEQRDGLPILTPDGFEWADCEAEDEEIEQVWLPEQEVSR